MRILILVGFMLGIPCLSAAQADKSSWANLNTLQPGQKIQVVEMSNQRSAGRFLSATEAAITLQDHSGERTFQKQNVRFVWLMRNKHRVRNTFIGAGVGGGIGAGIGAATPVAVRFTSRGPRKRRYSPLPASSSAPPLAPFGPLTK